MYKFKGRSARFNEKQLAHGYGTEISDGHDNVFFCSGLWLNGVVHGLCKFGLQSLTPKNSNSH